MMTTGFPGSVLASDLHASDLWEKLRRFSFDRGTGPRTFAARLAHEQGWTASFTALAIEEYRRFLLLFALDKCRRMDDPDSLSSVRIVPSEVVDKVWHLHLLYTQNYWEDLCRDILAGPLHHLPADGSRDEGQALQVVYEKTLAAYRRTFGHAAPASVWLGAESSGNALHRPLRAAATNFTRGSAGAAVLIGGGFLVSVLLVLGHVVPPAFLMFAVIFAVAVLAVSNHRRSTRGRDWSNGGTDTGAGGCSGDTSSGGESTGTHHDDGYHGGGGHDGGGHSHSCGGGHSCGGHGCGGGSCGGGGCGGH